MSDNEIQIVSEMDDWEPEEDDYDEDEALDAYGEERPRINPFDRATGTVRVLNRKCDTCVFRPGNLMHLREGGLEALVQANLKNDTVLTCHSTLPYGSHPEAKPAVCRGFYDVHKNDVWTLRLARMQDIVEEVDPPGKGIAAGGAA